MNRSLLSLFSIVSIVMVLFGILFAFFGLGVLPIIHKEILIPWESALYGAVMMGWGTTVFMIGRIAMRRKDGEIMRGILSGLVIWLTIEALFSAFYGVWFNVGVDIAVLLLFSLPLILSLRSLSKEEPPHK